MTDQAAGGAAGAGPHWLPAGAGPLGLLELPAGACPLELPAGAGLSAGADVLTAYILDSCDSCS